MKQFIVLISLTLLAAACGSPGQQEENPYSAEEQRALLKQKRAEMSALAEEIDRIEKELEIMDPSLKDTKRKLVTTKTIERKDFKRFVEIQGSVQADDLVDVTAEVAGRILKLTVEEGDPVKRGALIAELDLEQLDKQIAEVETSLDLAESVFERQARLWEQNIGSEIQYLQAKNNKERLEKSLETLHFQLNKSKVYAPASGVVERVVLQSGELASPGLPIIQILDMRKLKVVANVPETYLRDIKRGDQVTIQLPALDMETRARVQMIGNTIDPSNRTFEVEVGLSNGKGLIKPNLLAIMLVNDYEAKNQIVLPLELVQQEVGGRNFVLIRDEVPTGPIARKVYVETGESYEGEIEVVKGLKGNEVIIVEGARGLTDQEPITIVNTQKEENNG
jgi:membrane fusion protein (multidrug efflux system)